MSLIKKHRQLVESLEEALGNGWAVLKYPKKKSEKAIYCCNAAHIFSMMLKDFEDYLKCPICEIDKSIDRKSLDYKIFMESAREKNQELLDLKKVGNPDVHHIYSMRMFPEVSYHPENSVLLDRELHKDYHRYFSPYNTNGYTFLAWIKMRSGFWRMEFDDVKNIEHKVTESMKQCEYEISLTRNNENFNKNVDKLSESITDRKLLAAMERKSLRLVKKINHGQTLELVENRIILLNVYEVDALIYYKNDFGNWIEYNPISGSIFKNVYEQIMNA